MNKKRMAFNFANDLNHKEIEKIVLFGSVARGEDKEDSDIDILIITNKREDKKKIKTDIYRKIFNILLKTGIRISVQIRSSEYCNKYKNFSFLSLALMKTEFY